MKRIVGIVIIAIMVGGGIYIYLKQQSASDLPVSLIFSGIDNKTLERDMLEEFKRGFPEESRNILDTQTHFLRYIHTDINDDRRKDFVVTLDSKFTCGSGGCMTKIFIQDENKEFKPLNFSYAVKDIEILSTYTEHMRDLRINNDTAHRMIWNGESYIIETI